MRFISSLVKDVKFQISCLQLGSASQKWEKSMIGPAKSVAILATFAVNRMSS